MIVSRRQLVSDRRLSLEACARLYVEHAGRSKLDILEDQSSGAVASEVY